MKRVNSSIKAGALIGTSIKSKGLYFLLLLLVNSVLLHAANYKITDRTRIYTQEVAGDSLLFKADNDLSVPISIRLVLQLKNLQGADSAAVTAIVPAKATGYVIAGYKKMNRAIPYICNYSWKVVLGDISKTAVPGYVYSFPFQKVVPCKVSQGPGGDFSHHDMFAYDFVMPVGTPVTAARDGIVAAVKTDSFSGGPDKAYIEQANYISVYHNDGTIANYFHLNTAGALVKEGQVVKKGDVIGYSGNTGFTSGPHLHFEVVQPTLDSDKNVFVKFAWEAETEGFLASIYKTAKALGGRIPEKQ